MTLMELPTPVPPSRTKTIVLRALLGDFDPGKYGVFQPLMPGVDILPLYGRNESGQPRNATLPSAALLRYAPGASVPSHTHLGYEHILVLEGSQEDAAGIYTKGTCLISPPGSRHNVHSKDGCLVLAIWHQPVTFEANQEPA